MSYNPNATGGGSVTSVSVTTANGVSGHRIHRGLCRASPHSKGADPLIRWHASNDGNVRLRITCSAGTTTLRQNAMIFVRRIAALTTGTFAA